MEQPPQPWWVRAAALARRLETALLVLLLGCLIGLSTAQIVLRNVFSIGLAWSDGLIRLLVLWVALSGAVAASRDGRHITMGALARWLPEKLRVPAGFCADWFGGAVSAALAWYSWAFVRDSREFGDVLLGDVPAWWLQSIMPVAFALIALRFFLQGIARLRGELPSRTDPHL